MARGRAVELDQNYWRAWWMWGQALEGQGHLPLALEKYRQASALNPADRYLRAHVTRLERKLAR